MLEKEFKTNVSINLPIPTVNLIDKLRGQIGKSRSSFIADIVVNVIKPNSENK